jgi:chloramphenicol 3-O-phosphotransferase
VQTGDIAPAYQITTSDGSTGPAGTGALKVLLRGAGGLVYTSQYVEVYSQKLDIQNRPVRADRVGGASTDKSGTATFNLTSGSYILAVDFEGYNWGDAVEVAGKSSILVVSGKTTEVSISTGRLQVGFVLADGATIVSQYVEVHFQQRDIAGHLVSNGRAGGGSTNNTGAVLFDLTPGKYIVTSDLSGYSWGNAYNTEGQDSVPVQPGQITSLIIKLGRITVALRKADGSADVSQYWEIHTQKADVSGNLVRDARVSGGATDNAGRSIVDLTPGKYTVSVGNRVVTNVEVVAGKTTVFDGATASIQ